MQILRSFVMLRVTNETQDDILLERALMALRGAVVNLANRRFIASLRMTPCGVGLIFCLRSDGGVSRASRLCTPSSLNGWDTPHRWFALPYAK